MNKNKEYAKNTIILLLGKFATQFMSFLLIPLYTHYLLKEDYGTVDLLQTYVNLFAPILTLRFDSAVFRFLIDERKKNNELKIKEVISNVLLTICIMIFVCIAFYFIVGIFYKIKYFPLVIINIIAIMLSNILLQISRGLGNNKEYSIACVISAFCTLLLNCILILGFDFNAGSILISTSIANILCCLYVIIKNDIVNKIDLKLINKTEIKELLRYSIPMIPNALSWWIVNVSDRTIISLVMGSAFNAIYTISGKFSNILNSIFSIFNMSWQESTSLHIDDDDRDQFFSNMIEKILNLFSCISLIIISLIPLTFDILIGKDYLLAYNYIPILLFANIFQIIIQLFGGIYVAKKMTKKIMNTTIISAIINLIINFVFIHKFGLYAASVSTLIAYLTMCIYRYIDIQKYVKIIISKKLILRLIILFSVCSFFYYINNIYINLISLCIVLIYSFILNKALFITIIKEIKSKKRH